MAPALEDPEAPFSLGDPGDITLGDSEGLAIEVQDDVTNEAENEADIVDAGGDNIATREYWRAIQFHPPLPYQSDSSIKVSTFN
ncbi:hypothetical protein E4U19_006031 [Claviceps sp. Clav32 group G5]|nr:hypothetical protein E4U19_006031 [Claviceps sp. Clav32 group G5]